MRLGRNSLTAGILKAMAVFSGVQVVNIICSIVRTKLVALWIGPAGVGLLAIYNNTIELLSNSTQCNMRQSAVRDLSMAGSTDRPRIAGAVKWWGWRLGLFGGVVIILLSPLLSWLSFGTTSHWWAYIILSLAMVFTALLNSGQALMQGYGHLKALARAALWGSVGGTLLAIPVYRYLGEDGIVLSVVAIWFFVCLSTYVFLDVKGTRNTRDENLTIGRSFLKFGAYITVSSFVNTLASYIFLSFLTRTASTSTTGLYQAGYTLVVQYVGIIFTALSMEYYPRMAKIVTRKRMASLLMSHEMSLLVSLVTLPLVVFVAADRLAIQIFYTSEFYPMLPFIETAICAIVFRAISFCMAYVVLARGDGRTFIITETISSAVGLALNIAGYTYLGFVGLGISYVMWYIVYTIIMSVVVCGRYGMRVNGSTLIVAVCSVLILVASCVLKQVAWWAVLPMLVPAAMLPVAVLKGRRRK